MFRMLTCYNRQAEADEKAVVEKEAKEAESKKVLRKGKTGKGGKKMEAIRGSLKVSG